MLRKAARGGGGWRLLRRAGAALFVAEAAAFVGSYALWARLNTSREFRLYVHERCDWVLQGYYLVGETLGGEAGRAREADLAVWRAEGRLRDA